MEENIFVKFPNWLRYILSIPLGLISVIVCYYIGYWANLWIASPDSLMMYFFTFIYQNSINVFVLIGTICYVLPKYQFQFTLTISILFCSLGFVGLGMNILINNITISYIIGFILTFVSFVISCIYTFNNLKNCTIEIKNKEINNKENNINDWNEYLQNNYSTMGTTTNLNDIESNSHNIEITIKDITNNIERVSNIIEGKEKVNSDLFVGLQNPYTGEIISNYDDIILYFKMYKLDYEGKNPLSIK